MSEEKEYPAFGEITYCPKCKRGRGEAKIRYESEGWYSFGHEIPKFIDVPERMSITCCCGYVWCERPAS